MATETLSFDILARDLASASFRNAGRNAAGAAGGVKDLSDKLKDVSGRVAQARIDLKGDKEAEQSLDKLTLQMVSLSKRKIDPEIDLGGFVRARSQITGMELALDRLDHKHVTATVDVNVNRQGLRGLLGKLSSFGAGGGGGGGLGGLLGPLAGGGIAGGALVGAGLVPGVVGLGLGGAAGLGAIGGGLFGAAQGKKQLDADLANIKSITTRLKGAIGGQKTVLSQALKDASKQYQKDSRFFQPFTDFQKSIQNLSRTVLAPLRPIMGPLAQIFNDFGKGLAGLGPQFTALFRASLPFVKQFLQFMLTAGKILLPAFTQALNEMVKSGALKQMSDALVIVVQGLATFIKNLGPGMAASAQIFARVATFLGRLLGALGTVFSVIAKVLASDWSPAHLWNIIFASAKAFFSAVINSAKAFWHDIASIFDTIRHAIATAWDTIWRNTVNRAQTGISEVVGWFRGVTGRVLNALFGFGHSLYAFAHSAFNEFWNAIKNVGASIWHWLTSWVSALPGWLRHLLGIKSPSSVFYAIGKNMMLGLFHGIQDHAHHAANAARAATTGIGDTGARSGSARLAQSFARSVLPRGWSWPALLSLWNQESGWNAYAVNPSSGAYGIPQSLGHGHPFNLGDYKAQIMWGINYIATRPGYGNSQNAWAHEQAFGWYDKGGWLPPGLSLALNTTGRPEQVISGRGGTGGQTIIVRVDPTVAAVTPDRALGRHIADHLLAHVRAGGRLYPAGVSPR